MADLAASDVTYTINVEGWAGTNRGFERAITFAFGDSALTYPTGGVPLDASKLGCPNVISSLVISNSSSAVNTLWKYDAPNNKLRAYTPNTGAEFTGGSTAVAPQSFKAVVVGY